MNLIDILYDLNARVEKDDSLLEKLQINRIIRLCVRTITNTLITVWLKKSRHTLTSTSQVPITVSLTSFPKRINTVWMTIETMLRQQSKPQSIVLWLSKDQFPNELLDLPDLLIDQSKRGLSIRFVDGDIRSYKKFYYIFSESKEGLVLTIDDDLLFPSYFLNSIYNCHKEHPKSVIASFGFPYVWNDESDHIKTADKKIIIGEPHDRYFFGSGGGTLFNTEITKYMDSIETILNLCPTADDIYLNALAQINGYKVTFHMNNPLLSVVVKDDSKLVDHNGGITDANSKNAEQMKALRKYYWEKYHFEPFKSINQ